MKLSDKIEISGEVVAHDAADQTVLVDLVTGTRFGLNAVAAHFWQLLESGNTSVQARNVLADEYDVDPAQLDRDLEALLAELLCRGLVKRS